MHLARVQAQGKNSGPASKARYFVLSAFAHEGGILIGCLLLDSIIRSVIHHKGPLALARGGGGGVIFHDKAKNY
jgi:hypothetical protein